MLKSSDRSVDNSCNENSSNGHKSNFNYNVQIIKIDGTPYAVKVACTVWSRGKFRDNIKELPIAINDSTVLPGIIQNNPLSLDTLVEVKD